MTERGEQKQEFVTEAESIRIMMFMPPAELERLVVVAEERMKLMAEIDEAQNRVQELKKQLHEHDNQSGFKQLLLHREKDELITNAKVVLEAKGGTMPPAAEEPPPTTPTPAPPAAPIVELDVNERICLLRLGACEGCPIRAKDAYCKIKRRIHVRDQIKDSQQRLARIQEVRDVRSTGARSSKNTRGARAAAAAHQG